MRRWRWGGEGGTLWLRALRERKAGGGGEEVKGPGVVWTLWH